MRVRGLAYKHVAAELNIAVDTIRSHVRSLYYELHVHSVAEAFRRAIRQRLARAPTSRPSSPSD